MKTFEELKKLDTKKLAEELAEAQKILFKLQFEVKNGQSKSTNQIRANRKQIARMRTIVRQNEGTKASV